MSVRPPSRRVDFIFLALLEAAARAEVAARDASQGDGDDADYGDSYDEKYVEDTAVIRGAGAADFLVAQGCPVAPPLVVFLVEKAARSHVVVVISGALGAATRQVHHGRYRGRRSRGRSLGHVDDHVLLRGGYLRRESGIIGE